MIIIIIKIIIIIIIIIIIFSFHGHRPTLRNNPVSIELLIIVGSEAEGSKQASSA